MSESNIFEYLDKIPWYEVPHEKYRVWADVFNSAQESLNVSAPCPLCGERSLHCWYEGSALWQWCSSCGAFLHASAYLPKWWNPPLDIEIKTENLRVIPWAIEEARCDWEAKHRSEKDPLSSVKGNAGS
jgi:ribosomal protein L37AE/L43A